MQNRRSVQSIRLYQIHRKAEMWECKADKKRLALNRVP